MAAEDDLPPLDPEGLWLVAGILEFPQNSARIPELRRRLMAPGAFAKAMETAGFCRLLPVFATEVRRKGLALRIPGKGGEDGNLSPAAAVDLLLETHAAERRVFTEELNEIIGLLNGIGIVPVLLKGARSLWRGEPAWRGMRDLDLLVPDPKAAIAAEERLLKTGYGQLPDMRETRRNHHRTPLGRAVSTSWVEIHLRAGKYLAERLLPTSELLAGATTETRSASTVKLLSPEHHVLHALVHHHAGHSAFVRRFLDIKGLYEFAFELGALEPAGRERLYRRAMAHPRLAAMLDLWVAAAAELFAFKVEPSFAIDDDATARWQDIRRQLHAGKAKRRLPGYADEIAFASRTARLRRRPEGATAAGRMAERLKVVASLIPRSPWAER
jgi:hypothetical protein